LIGILLIFIVGFAWPCFAQEKVKRTLIKITAEQGILKEPLPQPAKYIDQSYLKQALAEVGKNEK
jgi:hypothetical protein